MTLKQPTRKQRTNAAMTLTSAAVIAEMYGNTGLAKEMYALAEDVKGGTAQIDPEWEWSD